MNLVVTQNITLDGVIEMTGSWFDPASGEEADNSDIVVAALREQMEGQDAVLLGRNTFESFRSYWPQQTDDTTGITVPPEPGSEVRGIQHCARPRVGEHHRA